MHKIQDPVFVQEPCTGCGTDKGFDGSLPRVPDERLARPADDQRDRLGHVVMAARLDAR
jgi:hypothetical protein